MNGQVYILEPICNEFEHVQFNAPLVLSVLLAYPDATVRFIASASHCDHVRAALERHFPEALARVEWNTITIPGRTLRPLARLREEHRLIKGIFRQARNRDARAILFASATDTAVLSTKVLLASTSPGCPVVMILHSVMKGLEQQEKLLSRWRGISLALRFPHPRGLRFVVPSSPFLVYLAERFPRIARHFSAMEHPWFWRETTLLGKKPPPVVRFGHFGVSTAKGFDMFARIAAELTAEGIPAEYSMIGYLNNPADKLLDLSAVPDARHKALTPEEYAERARRITYAIWTTHSQNLGLMASSTFVDALSSLTPVLYIANHLLDAYARIIGDFGYSCSNEQELKSTMRMLALKWPKERYRRQQEAILAGRTIFDPASVSTQLRTIIEEVRDDR